MGAENKDGRMMKATPEIEALGLMSDALEVVATALSNQFPDHTSVQIKGLIETAFEKNVGQIDQYVDEVRAIGGEQEA